MERIAGVPRRQDMRAASPRIGRDPSRPDERGAVSETHPKNRVGKRVVDGKKRAAAAARQRGVGSASEGDG